MDWITILTYKIFLKKSATTTFRQPIFINIVKYMTQTKTNLRHLFVNVLRASFLTIGLDAKYVKFIN